MTIEEFKKITPDYIASQDGFLVIKELIGIFIESQQRNFAIELLNILNGHLKLSKLHENNQKLEKKYRLLVRELKWTILPSLSIPEATNLFSKYLLVALKNNIPIQNNLEIHLLALPDRTTRATHQVLLLNAALPI